MTYRPQSPTISAPLRTRPTSPSGLTDDDSYEDNLVRYSRRTTTIHDEDNDITDGYEGVNLTPPESPPRIRDGVHRTPSSSAIDLTGYLLPSQIGVGTIVAEKDHIPEPVRWSSLQREFSRV